MGKRPVGSKVANSVAVDDGTKRPFDAALGSILTADEYCSAVIALVHGVEDVFSDDNDNMADLSSALRRLLLSRHDPPLALWWTFIAVEKSVWLDRTSTDPLEVGTRILNFASRVSRSLNSLSAVNASGRTALSATAPIVGLLYDVVSLLSATIGSLDETDAGIGTVDGKQALKLAKSLKESIKELLSFTVLCHYKDSKTFERSLSLPAAPNVPMENFPDFLYPPFPLASKQMAKSRRGDSSNAAFLGEIVFGEVVLLQLVVETIHRRILLKKQNTNFSAGKDEFVQKLKNLAVHSVWARSSASPSEMLLDLLLEKRLPVLDVLDAKEEILVRGVLFETVLVGAPLFCLSGEADGEAMSSNSGLDHTSVVFMKKLSVARKAVAFFRSLEERRCLATLLIEMTTWHVPPQLLKWLKSQKKQWLPVVACQDQQALTNWLVNVAEKSVFTAILDKSVATWSSRLTSVGSAKHVEVLEVGNSDAYSNREGEDLFFVDTAGETQAEIDAETAADLDFTAAALSMKGESVKMTKKKMKQSKVLFHRHEQSSTRLKRGSMEIDDVHLTSSSGSDSEDSEENGSKSAKKKVESHKRELVDIIATSEEDEDEVNDGALASADFASREEKSPPVKRGDFSDQLEAELHLPQRAETPKETVITSVSGNEMDIQNSSTISEVEPVFLSPGKSAKKKKKSKDPEDPDNGERSDTVGKSEDEPLSTPVPNKRFVNRDPEVNTEGKCDAHAEEIIGESQNSLAVFQSKPVLLSVGKSAKKKKNKSKDQDILEPTDTVGKRKDGPVVTGIPRETEARTEGKAVADVEEHSLVNTAIQTVDTRTDAQEETAKNLSQTVTTTTCEGSLSSLLTTHNKGSECPGEISHVTAVVQSASSLRNVQDDVHIVKSNKKKRLKENPSVGVEDDEIFDTIRQELVAASANASSAALIDALQVGKSPPTDQQVRSRKMSIRSKRARLGDEGNNIADIQGAMTRETGGTDSVINSDKTKIAHETTHDRKGSQGNLSATLMKVILGSGQAEDTSGQMHAESEQNISSLVVTQADLPVDGVVLGEEDVAQDTSPPLVRSAKSPIKKGVEKTRLQTQGTRTSGTIGTSPGSHSKKNRDVAGTPTSRKTKSKVQTDVGLPAGAGEIVQRKEGVCEETLDGTPAEMLDGGKGEEERGVRTPDAKGQISGKEVLTSVKGSSRKQKVKPSTPQSVVSEMSEEGFYERRTRSGRSLGTPPPTARKGNMRRKLVLEPLDE